MNIFEEPKKLTADTFQGFLTRARGQSDPSQKHLYMVDESSQASTEQMRNFLSRIRPEDKVLLIGDVRQHQGVDAGKPLEQLQHFGMRSALLDRIVRQKDPDLVLWVLEDVDNALVRYSRSREQDVQLRQAARQQASSRSRQCALQRGHHRAA